MPALRSLIEHVFGSAPALYECRNCGTTREEDSEQCPESGAADIPTDRLAS